jgi:putative membrane protein
LNTEPRPSPASPADPRIYLAAERTLLAWVRTGLALMGLGFVASRFGFLTEPGSQHSGISLWGGIAMVALGILVNVQSSVAYWRTVTRLNRGEPLTFSAVSPGIVLALVLAILGVALVAYMGGVV